MTTRAEKRREERKAKKGEHVVPAAVIGWLYGDDVAGPFNSSIAKTFMDDALMGPRQRFCRPDGGFLNISSGPLITPNRNKLVQEFLNSFPDAEWLVTVDADMCWGSTAVHTLIETAEAEDYDILGGLCFAAARNGHSLYPTIYVANELSEQTGMPKMQRILDYPRDALLTCDATGAAFTCVRRSVLEKMFDKFGYVKHSEKEDGTWLLVANPHPWYADIFTEDGGFYGEDISFCLRARQVGAKLGVDTRIKVGHVKPRILGEREWDEQQAGPRAIDE